MNDFTRDDRALFERTALPFTSALYGTAWRLTRDADAAADLVQETYLRAYRTFRNFEPGTNCKAWLFTILYSVYSNSRRRQRRQPETLSVEEFESRGHRELRAGDRRDHHAMLSGDDLRWTDPQIERALVELPVEYRATVLMVDVEQLTYEEASRAMGCPVGTVRSRLARARKALYGALLDYARQAGYCGRKEGS